MSIRRLDFCEPFFTVKYIAGEEALAVSEKSILLNLAPQPIRIEAQGLGQFQSAVVLNTELRDVQQAALVGRFADYADEGALLEEVKRAWPLAYDIRREERLKGKAHYMSPKSQVGNLQFSMYCTASVPLNVGLHREHPHLGGEEPQEVHTQIVGCGKMQQCRERDLKTLYLEDMMAPGCTHRPMFDEALNYPWHQYETVTPGIIMAVEILTSGRPVPANPPTPANA